MAASAVVLGALAVVTAKEPEDPVRNVVLLHEVWRGQVRVFADDRLCAVVEHPGDEPRAMLCTHTGQWVLAPEYAESPIFLAWGRAMAIVAKAAVAFCDQARDIHSAAASDALGVLIDAANTIRSTLPRKVCDLQCADYPEHRCTRRARHKGMHTMRGSGCSWG